jgi:hypothetical protein
MTEESSYFNRDSDGYLLVKSDLQSTEAGGTGQTTVGLTAVQITATPTAIKSVTIKALSTNTDIVYVGFSNAVITSTGFELTAGQAWCIDIDDLSNVWVISNATGQKICYGYVI